MKGYTIQNSIDLLEKTVEKIENTPAPTTDVDADDVSYDNTSSGLTADDVQAAIDELNSSISAINSKTLEFGTTVVDSSLSDFQAANDTYTVDTTGIAAILIGPSSTSAAACQITCDSHIYRGAMPSGGFGFDILIPVKAGDVLTLTEITNATVSSISIRPMLLTTPTNNTRKVKKGGK